MTNEAISRTEIKGAPAPRRGKVRDIYDLDDKLLIIATDRVSAFDVVLPDAIPGKGKVLTQISLFWFRQVEDIIPNHIISAEVSDFPEPFKSNRDILEGRSILARRAAVLPVECIARGYLSGSGWKSYEQDKTVCGIKLPPGLRESSRLPAPIFTPSTKAAEGHDCNISFEDTKKVLGAERAEELKKYTLEVYGRASGVAAGKGIIIADTKMEFGTRDGKIILIDELLTPDSSRFWSGATYAPGKGQDSYDKQIIRDYLIGTGWDFKPPAPRLPGKILEKAARRYREIQEILTR